MILVTGFFLAAATLLYMVGLHYLALGIIVGIVSGHVLVEVWYR